MAVAIQSLQSFRNQTFNYNRNLSVSAPVPAAMA